MNYSGWRGWFLTFVKGEPFLRSLSFASRWEGPVFTSDVKPEMKPVWSPFHWGPSAVAGIWTYKVRPKSAIMGLQVQSIILGRVNLAGKVVIHKHGYRAEKALIRELYLGRRLVTVGNGDVRTPMEELPRVSSRRIPEIISSFQRRYQCVVKMQRRDDVSWAQDTMY